MRKFLLLLCTLLGTVGAWADVLTLTPSNGTYVTSSGNYVNSISFSTTPAITVTASANNMDKNKTSTYLQWHSGKSGSSTYTISVAGDYAITGYSVTGEANTSAQTLTAGSVSHEFAVGTSSSFEVTGLQSSSVSFVQSGDNGSGLKITSISVTVVPATDEQIAAYNTVQGWVPTIQGTKGLVKDAANYVSNAKSSAEGSYGALLDGDYTTYFHGAYGSQSVPSEDQYLQATLPNAVNAIYFYFKKRSQNNANRPTSITISGSNDGSSFTDITTINSGLPTDASVLDYTSSKINLGASYQYIRFTVTSTNNGATHSNGHVFFTFSEFYILPSETEVDNVMDLRAALAGTSAVNYTAQNISDVTAANTALLNTVVDVTYALYESDGTTFVSNTVVEQEKNSAVSIPSAISNYTYYDYATEGTIGTEDCIIKVTRTLKSGYVISLDGLSNSKCYNIRNNRSTWAVGSGATVVNSISELNLAFMASDTKQQFAFITYEGNVYLYSVGEGKFAYIDGTKLSLTADVTSAVAASPVTFQASTAPHKYSEPIIVTIGGNMYGVSTGKSPDVFKYNDHPEDDGNCAIIIEAGSFDATSALAALEEYFHPSYTVTYIVKDGSDNVLFTSDPVATTNGANITTLPAEYQLTNFYEYNTVNVTISSSGNTNVEFTATPKSDAPVKYTADTSNPYYYNLNIRSQYLVYNSDATGDVTLQSTSEPFNPNASWAFIGDPYAGFKVINKTKGTGNFLTYTSVVTGGNSGNNNIQFVPAADFTNQYWIIDTNSNGLVLRMKENTNIYFHHDNTHKLLRTCSVNEWSDVHNDAGSTIEASTDEDVLIALYNSMKDYTYSDAIGQYSAEGLTAADAKLTITQVGAAINGNLTTAYGDAYAALNELQGKTTLNSPAAGLYRVKNVATNGYLYATAVAAGYTSTDRYVYANGNNSGAETIVQLVEHEGHLYMLNQGHEFGWVAQSSTYSGQVGYVKANNFDKYVNWLPGTAAGQIAFAICYGNGTGDYASYLTQGIYAVDTNDNAVIRGTEGYTANTAQWIFEPVSTLDITLNGPVDGKYYATLCVPFDITALNGANAYTLTMASDGRTLNSTEVTTIPAGTPVLLEGSTASATATISAASSSAISTETALTGQYFASVFNGETNYTLGTDGTKVGFFHWTGTTLAANRAYVAGSTGGNVKGFYLNFDELVDGIKGIDNGQLTKDDAAIFNLAGQRLSKLQKGVNIVNGKKVLVK